MQDKPDKPAEPESSNANPDQKKPGETKARHSHVLHTDENVCIQQNPLLCTQ